MYPWMYLKKKNIHFNGVKLKKKILPKIINNKIKISFVGRVVVENNPEFFINIAIEFLKYNKKTIFNVFGEGLLLNYIKKKYEQKNIIFHGWAKKNEIYKNSNIVIITSPVNNFPYVALEAKSYGIPVISTSKGDIRKIIKNNFDGYVIQSKSTKKIINLIKKILNNYSKFTNNSIQRSKLFDLNISCKKFWRNVLW